MNTTPDVPHDPQQELVMGAESLKQFLVNIFVQKGMYAVEAEMAAERLVEADLRGIHSHGSRAVARYIEAMDRGDIDPRGTLITETETPAVGVLDGSRALGHVAATRGMQLAIQKARDVGTGTVAVKHSHHFGAASVYALMAVREGLIGYCTTSTAGATVAAYGSRQPATANNAFAWGVPTRSGPPFVLDMACAVSSWGKVESLKMYGLPLPPGWALDSDGNETLDPSLAKTLLPASGARGFGLAIVSSVLAGALVGGKTPIHKTRHYSAENSEHFFYVIDISRFVDPDRFYREWESTLADIRALPAAEGFDRVRLPGELEWERSEKWTQHGIPFHRDHVAALEDLAARLKIAVPWPTSSGLGHECC